MKTFFSPFFFANEWLLTTQTHTHTYACMLGKEKTIRAYAISFPVANSKTISFLWYFSLDCQINCPRNEMKRKEEKIYPKNRNKTKQRCKRYLLYECKWNGNICACLKAKSYPVKLTQIQNDFIMKSDPTENFLVFAWIAISEQKRTSRKEKQHKQTKREFNCQSHDAIDNLDLMELIDIDKNNT